METYELEGLRRSAVMTSANVGAITKPQALQLIEALAAAQQREIQLRHLVAKLRYLVEELEAVTSLG